MDTNPLVRKYFSVGIILLFLVANQIPVIGIKFETNSSTQKTSESDFTVIPLIRYLPPYTPKNPRPEDNAVNIPINTHLSWTGGDPDIDDLVTYDVFFGSVLPIQKVASNISNTSYTPKILADHTTYTWRIVAWDNHSQSTQGPSWHFTTSDTTNNPPKKPNRPSGLIKGNAGYEYSYSTTTIDPDGDEVVYYLWDWGDGNYSGWIGPINVGVVCEAKHTWDIKGNYNITVKAKDKYDFESDWSDPFLISMPYSYTSIRQFLELLSQRFSNTRCITLITY